MPVILVSQRSTSEFCELAPEGYKLALEAWWLSPAGA